MHFSVSLLVAALVAGALAIPSPTQTPPRLPTIAATVRMLMARVPIPPRPRALLPHLRRRLTTAVSVLR